MLALGFARLSLPLQLMEREDFINMLLTVQQSTCRLPSKHALGLAQVQLANDLRSRLINRLRQFGVHSPVTVGVDGWTNVRRDKVTNILPLCASNAYYWTSIVNTSHGSVDADIVEMEDDNVDDLQDADPVVITDPVDVFIRQYIRDNHITAGYRWKEWRVNQLESAAATAASRGLLPEPRETVTKYIAMIKALVTTATDENVQSV